MKMNKELLNKIWVWIKKMCLNVEFLGFAIIIALCIYFYFKYDKNKIRFDTVDYSPLFLAYVEEKSKKSKIRKAKPVWKSQEKCKTIFEKIFKKKFPSVRPNFLKNPVTHQNLELDGYCNDLRLAFEYDGNQHAKYNPHFHKKGPQEFIYQVTKDDYKSKKCKLEGIDLIRIPHYIHSENLEDYIIKELRSINRLPPHY